VNGPRVVLHVAVSLDGRTAGFTADHAALRRLVGTWPGARVIAGDDPTMGELLGRGGVEEVSLLVHPVIAGEGHPSWSGGVRPPDGVRLVRKPPRRSRPDWHGSASPPIVSDDDRARHIDATLTRTHGATMSFGSLRHPIALGLLSAAVALGLDAGAAAAQRGREEGHSPRVLLTAWSGFSLREGQRTIRFADDVVSFGARVSLNRRASAQPWVQVDHFTRPDLSCPPGVPCNTDGILARAGLTLPFTEDDTRPGFHPRLLGGIGAGFSEETALSYLIVLGGAWSIHPRFAPIFEIRWERLPGLSNILILGLGLRTGLL
jgi:hypothetical protein